MYAIICLAEILHTVAVAVGWRYSEQEFSSIGLAVGSDYVRSGIALSLG